MVEGPQQVNTIFGLNEDATDNTPSDIPTVPPAYIHFPAPTGTAGGSCINPAYASIWANALTGKIDSVRLFSKGSGYTQAPNVVISDASTNGHGAISTTSAPDLNGKINSITLNNIGSGYINPQVALVLFNSISTARGIVNVDANGVINENTPVSLLDNSNFSPSTISGNGYKTDTSVTLVPAIPGVGSGAVARTIINISGQICGVKFTNLGSGYVAKNYPTTSQSFQMTPDANSFMVQSGQTYVRNIYLGTGKRTIEN